MVRVLIFAAAALVALAPGGHGAENEASFVRNVRQLTFEGKSGEGYFSPDGKELIFQSTREPGNPFYQIYIMGFETGDIHRVSPGSGKTTCAFFRAGTNQVLFASTHHDPTTFKKQEEELAFIASGKTRRYSWDYDAEMEIYLADRDGSNLKRLTETPGYDAEAAFSPDGKKIVFSSVRSAYPVEKLSAAGKKRYETDPAYFAELYVMSADGSGQRRLTHQTGYDGGPFFTADGERIVWRRFDTNGLIADVYSMKIDGTDERRITRFESMSWAPYPHPSGKYIIFTSNKLGFENFELFMVDMEGRSAPVRVSFTEGFDGLPVFSPDGNKLCWTSNRGGGGKSQLFMAEWNHEAALAALGTKEDELAGAPGAAGAGSPLPLSAEITAEDVRNHVQFLASDAMEGRKTGERGARKAAAYLAKRMKEFGLNPITQTNSSKSENAFLQRFEFPQRVDVRKAETKFVVAGEKTRTFEVEKDFLPLSFSSNGNIEGEVVFAGYGLSVPGKPGEGYDSYAGLDVTNKIVLVLRYVPENVSPARRQELNRYAGPPYKAMLARERGAKAILFVSGPNSPNAGKLIPLSSEGVPSDSAIVAASITAEVAEAIFGASGKSLKDLQANLDEENPHAEKAPALMRTKVSLSIALDRVKSSDHNVIAMLPGETAEYVMVGAHYDHLGFGEEGASREQSGEKGEVHNGADDNASGVAAVLELAQHFAKGRPGDEPIKPIVKALAESGKPALKRGLIFAFWSGEEMGLLGSSHFAEHPPLPLTNIVAYVNFDMIGRLQTNKLTLQGIGSSSAWRRMIERRNIVRGFDLNLMDDPYLPSDTTAFYPKGIPVLAFFTGTHDDYHRPSDDGDKLDYEGVERITKLANVIVGDLANADSRPAYVKVERSNAPGSRDSLRAYLGTIPDYSTEVKGVKISGVRGGSPAEKAGLAGGDVIIEFAGQKIANIYDYTYALDAAKIGQPLKIKVLRKDQPVDIMVTPEARK